MSSVQNNGVGWHITDKRKVDVTEMLKRQWTLASVAGHYGIASKTLSKALKAAGVDWKAVRMSGISLVRARLYDDITMIDLPRDRALVALKYLERYDREEVEDDSGDDVVDVDLVTAKIMLEMK